MGFRFFVDPGYLGRPLCPADSSGPVGPLPCLSRSRRFIGGPLALLVEFSVSLQSWQAFHTWVRVSCVSLYYGRTWPCRPAHVFSIHFGSLSPVGWLVWVVRPFSPVEPLALWSGPSFLMAL